MLNMMRLCGGGGAELYVESVQRGEALHGRVNGDRSRGCVVTATRVTFLCIRCSQFFYVSFLKYEETLSCFACNVIGLLVIWNKC